MGNFINFCIDSTNAFFYDDYDDYHRLCKESHDCGVERIPSDNVEAINSNYDLIIITSITIIIKILLRIMAIMPITLKLCRY